MFAASYELPSADRRKLLPYRVIVLGTETDLTGQMAEALTNAGYLVRIARSVADAARLVTGAGTDAVISTLPLDQAQSICAVLEGLPADSVPGALPVIACVEENGPDMRTHAFLAGLSETCAPLELVRVLETLIHEDQ
jgi:DNA-binding NtrC family response regulator